MSRNPIFLRLAILLALGIAAALLVPLIISADEAAVQLDASKAAPRQIEDTTEKAIVRDYTRAWEALRRALENNQPGALDAAFTGTARDQLAAAIEAQKQSGLRTRYLDRGHKLEAVFYSPEGSAMQLRDTAHIERQVLDGGRVIHSEQLTARYIVLMTVAETNWKVRVLQEVESF